MRPAAREVEIKIRFDEPEGRQCDYRHCNCKAVAAYRVGPMGFEYGPGLKLSVCKRHDNPDSVFEAYDYSIRNFE